MNILIKNVYKILNMLIFYVILHLSITSNITFTKHFNFNLLTYFCKKLN